MNKITTYLYRYYDERDNLLYIGIAYQAIHRLSQHVSKQKWADEIRRVTIEEFPSRRAAWEAESEAIFAENPKYNIAGKPSAQNQDIQYTEIACKKQYDLTTTEKIEKLVLTVPEAAQALGVGRNKLYQLINCGDLPAKKCGKKTFILKQDLLTFINGLPDFTSEGAAA